jgi:FHS family L-fucose permease-like MFS transporter
LISFAFYVAYTVGSLIYFGISAATGRDLLHRLGYRNGLSLGLLISAVGTLLFIPASDNGSFPLLLAGLFTVGLGFSLQQIAANPLAIRMGDPASANMRLSLAGGVNNVGTTIGPVIVAFAIFGAVGAGGGTTLDLGAVKAPYLILGSAFVLAAVFFRLSNVPDRLDSGEGTQSNTSVLATLKYPQVWLGMGAIFLYVGVEVSTASNLPEFMRQRLGTPESAIAPFVSLFWASLMIGRWTSAAGAFNLSSSVQQRLSLLLPFVAFGLFLLVNLIAGNEVEMFYPYLFLVLVLAVADAVSEGNPVRQIVLYSALGALSLVVGIFADGMVSVFAFIAVGLFCSTLWPCIFTLGISGLGEHTNTASSLLIMMIMGGGVVSVAQGWLADDAVLGIAHSYWIGVACFAYLAFFALRVNGLLKKQGISLAQPAPGH